MIFVAFFLLPLKGPGGQYPCVRAVAGCHLTLCALAQKVASLPGFNPLSYPTCQ